MLTLKKDTYFHGLICGSIQDQPLGWTSRRTSSLARSMDSGRPEIVRRPWKGVHKRMNWWTNQAAFGLSIHEKSFRHRRITKWFSFLFSKPPPCRFQVWHENRPLESLKLHWLQMLLQLRCNRRPRVFGWSHHPVQELVQPERLHPWCQR